MSLSLAIVGATGLVGRALLTVLEQRNFPIDHLTLLAGDRSAGQVISFKHKDYTVLSLAEFDWKKQAVDIALFSAGNEVSLRYAPIARDSGCIVIDNSSAFRYDDDIPLIVPEVNGDELNSKKGQIIANPNCSTIQLVMVLAPIHALVGVKRVFVSTYQAVSGAGQALVDTLKNGEPSDTSIHHNVIPQIDTLQDNGYSREEMKMLWESRKILNASNLLLSATAVRVPVMNAHSESVVIETEKPFSVTQAIQCLNDKPGLVVLENHWVTPKEVSGKDDIFVSRIRQDLVFGKNGLSFWIVADNLRKGAALNAVQIAEVFVSKGFV